MTALQLDIEDAAPAKKSRKEVAVATPAKQVTTSATATNDVAAVFAMIERLASNPDAPIERVEQLFDLYKRMQSDRARQAYYAAFADMQPKLPIIERKGEIKHDEKDAQGKKTGNQVVQSKYAKWEDIVEGITKILAEGGFALSFKIDQPTVERVVVTGTLSHRDGHSESTSFSLPIDTSGSKNNVQGWASSVSYGKRYTGCALLNIVSRGEDDDGKAAGASGGITDEQIKTIFDLITETNSNFDQFLIVAKVAPIEEGTERDIETIKAKISEIKPADFKRLHDLLEKKKSRSTK